MKNKVGDAGKRQLCKVLEGLLKNLVFIGEPWGDLKPLANPFMPITPVALVPRPPLHRPPFPLCMISIKIIGFCIQWNPKSSVIKRQYIHNPNHQFPRFLRWSMSP